MQWQGEERESINREGEMRQRREWERWTVWFMCSDGDKITGGSKSISAFPDTKLSSNDFANNLIVLTSVCSHTVQTQG